MMPTRYVLMVLPTSWRPSCVLQTPLGFCSLIAVSSISHDILLADRDVKQRVRHSYISHIPAQSKTKVLHLPMPAQSSRRRSGRRSRRRTYADSTPLALQPKPSQLINVSQLQGGSNIVKGAIDAGTGYSFTLSSLPNYTAFSVFDMYRINFVEVEYLLNQTTATVTYPTLYWTPDYDDASSPTSLGALQSFETAEVFQYSPTAVSFRRKIVPKPAQTAYVGGLASGFVVGSPKLWINSDSPGVQYFGMKHWIANYNSTTANSTNIIIVVRYNLSFKMVK